MPDNASRAWADRSVLWNAVEARKPTTVSHLASEVVVALLVEMYMLHVRAIDNLCRVSIIYHDMLHKLLPFLCAICTFDRFLLYCGKRAIMIQ